MWWIACGGGLIGMAVGVRPDLADRDVVADQRRRAADLRLVAEPDHHVRADDARRDSRDRRHACWSPPACRPRRKLYDPEVTDGKILVGVENPPDSSLDAFEKALRAPPGAGVKKI